MHLPPVEVIIGPGPLQPSLGHAVGSNAYTVMSQPSRTAFNQVGQLFTSLTEPAQQNPRAGPNSPTWMQNNYTLHATDSQGHARQSTDQIFVRMSRERSGVNLGPSSTAQPKPDKTLCFATQRILGIIQNATFKPTDGTSLAGLMAECGKTECVRGKPQPCGIEGCDDYYTGTSNCIQVITPGAACRHDTSGAFQFLANFTDTGDATNSPGFGVYELEMYICDLQTIVNAADPVSALASCLSDGIDGADDTRPQFRSYSATNIGRTQIDPLPMDFSICPANSQLTAGKWSQTGGTGAGFVQGSLLHLCTCGTGYSGRKGGSCNACGKGKFTSTLGAPTCSGRKLPH